MFVCTEDWFFYSHFLPLIKAAKEIEGSHVMLATTTSGRHEEIEKLGVDILPVNFDRSSFGLGSAAKLTWQLIRLFQREKPDLVHFIALKPVLLGGLARAMKAHPAAIYHVTGLGTLAEKGSLRKRAAAAVLFRIIGLYTRRSFSALLVENPDDLAFLRGHGVNRQCESMVLGGAGLDTENYPALPLPRRSVVRLGFVGRMIATKGVDVLINAMALCNQKGPAAELDLYGKPDPSNPGSFRPEQLEEWGALPGIHYNGYVSDIIQVWKDNDICVVPTRTREGMPRAMLEAASCARPLIVTNVPGCRHFVREGIEGFIVPPEDPVALARAISRLAQNRELRKKMGLAARQRVLEGYTESHVINDVARVYERLLVR